MTLQDRCGKQSLNNIPFKAIEASKTLVRQLQSSNVAPPPLAIVNLVPQYDSIDFNAAALRLRSHRQEILASNLANADTPGYQARDVAFDVALREQMQGVSYQGRLPLAVSHGQHRGSAMAGSSGMDGPALLYRSALQPSVDGNTVDPDVERAHFAENTVGFELAAALLGRAVKSRQMAITGQP